MIVPKAGSRTWTVDIQTQIVVIAFTVDIITTDAFLLTLRRFNSNPSDFSEDLLPQSKALIKVDSRDSSWRGTEKTGAGSCVDLCRSPLKTAASIAMWRCNF
nr:uncharacterized protein LOC117991620 [Maniola hyperantus]